MLKYFLIITNQDPREALIVALKREVSILQQENNHLRQLVDLPSDSSASSEQGLVVQSEASQLVVAGYGHYVDGRGKRHGQSIGRMSSAHPD